MLYTIIITACLGLEDCKTYEKRVYDLPVLPTAQFQAAQIIVAEWSSQHPARVVKAFRIERVRIGEQSI